MIRQIKVLFRKIQNISKYPIKIHNFNRWYKLNVPSLLYVCVDGIGDIVWFMSFWEQYKKKNNIGNDYKILAPKRHWDMFMLYGEHNLMENSEDFIPLIMQLWKRKKLYKYSHINLMAFPKDNGKKINLIEGNYRASIGLMMDDCYRFGCFDLSYEFEDPIRLPDLAETDCKLTTTRNVILVPYTNSRINIPLDVWEKIANTLKAEGYTVYTNVGTPKEKNVNGTIPLNAKIIELPAILRKYDFISICGRCGLADWLFVNECKQIIIHSCKKYPKNRYEWLCSSVDKKDNFKVMKRKCLLNENNAEDLYFYIDNMIDDYVAKTVSAVKKLENYK